MLGQGHCTQQRGAEGPRGNCPLWLVLGGVRERDAYEGHKGQTEMAGRGQGALRATDWASLALGVQAALRVEGRQPRGEGLAPSSLHWSPRAG